MPDDLESARAVAVVDLGFGDAGKGAVVDRLTRAIGADLVVRFNGGAQAGHNVVTASGAHHTFAQFGAGTFAGARTHLARHVVVHPTAALVEAAYLERAGIPRPLDALSIDPDALVVTPFHQAACRLRELGRGASRHGSCGVGVGEVMRLAIADEPIALRAREIADPITARRLLRRIREAVFDPSFASIDHPRARDELRAFDDDLAERWLAEARTFFESIRLEPDRDVLRRASKIVFEGAQGVLLDEHLGFHPFTTWSRCGFDNAVAIAEDAGFTPFRLGVSRAFAHRHGPGPLPTETSALDAIVCEPHNVDGPWQGGFRIGWTDLVLARYARLAAGSIDGLALTHLDAVDRAPAWSVCERYAEAIELALPADAGDLDARAASTDRLLGAKPVLRAIVKEELVETIAGAYRARVLLEGRGPTAGDLRAPV